MPETAKLPLVSYSDQASFATHGTISLHRIWVSRWISRPIVGCHNTLDDATSEMRAAVRLYPGSFNVYLQGAGPLKDLSQSLFSSKSAPGSQITVRPVERATAMIEFKLELEYPAPGRSIKEGDGRLVVDWEQTAISVTIHRNGCLVGSGGFFRYTHY